MSDRATVIILITLAVTAVTTIVVGVLWYLLRGPRAGDGTYRFHATGGNGNFAVAGSSMPVVLYGRRLE